MCRVHWNSHVRRMYVADSVCPREKKNNLNILRARHLNKYTLEALRWYALCGPRVWSKWSTLSVHSNNWRRNFQRRGRSQNSFHIYRLNVMFAWGIQTLENFSSYMRKTSSLDLLYHYSSQEYMDIFNLLKYCRTGPKCLVIFHFRLLNCESFRSQSANHWFSWSSLGNLLCYLLAF